MSSLASPLADRITTAESGRGARTEWIDHLRVGLTFLVVLHHVAIAYGGSGGWYWKDLPEASSLPLLLFGAINQSFFMGFFFLLAGYYTPSAYERKGWGRFLGDRLLRLGLPLAGYFLLLSPLTLALARVGYGESFAAAWGRAWSGGHLEPGPLWFAEALLLLAGAYVIWRWLVSAGDRAREQPERLTFAKILLLVLGIGLTNVLVRLWLPVGQSVLWLQLGYFPAYLVFFTIGCAAAAGRGLERVTWRQAWPWAVVSLVAIALLPLAIASASQLADFLGGWNRFAVFYAFWDPLVAAGIVLSLLYLARSYMTGVSVVMRWLARRAFGIFIVHPPVVVGLGLLLRNWMVAGELKFLVVGLLSCAGSALVADLLLRLPGAKRVL